MNLIVSKCWQGQTKKGVHKGAEILSKHFQYFQEHDNLQITNIPTKKFYNKIRGYHRIFRENLKTFEDGKLPVNLGGDHSISGATLASSIKYFGDDLRVVWVDAHPDINTIESSPSGNFHGMPVASAMHLMKPWVNNVFPLKPEQIIYLGLRDIDPFEKKLIEEKNITHYTCKEINDKGIENVFQEIDSLIKDKKIHYSFDIDSMDPVIAPSTGTPVKDGLYCNDIYYIQSKLFELGNVINCDFVEYNPNIGKKFDSEITKHTYRKVLDQFVSFVPK